MAKSHKWIKGAIKPENRGKFKAKAEAAGKTTAEFAREHEHDSGATGSQARLAETLMGMQHKSKTPKERMAGRYGAK